MKWETKKISDLTGHNGLFKDGDWIESKDQDQNGEIRLIQMADIGENIYKNKSEKFLTKDTFINLKCTKLEIGDLLIARMPDPIGRTCIFEGDQKDCCTVVDIAILRVDNNSVFNKWLMYRLNYNDIRNQIISNSSGTTRKRISRSKLGDIQIPLPPLDIQKKIADTLDKAQELIDKRKEQISALDKFLENLFLDMFGDPVSNPMGWERGIIENVTSLVSSGSTPKGGSNVYSTEGIYFIRSQNVLMNKLKLEDISFINNDIHNSMKRTWLKNNDVLLNITGASIGRVAYYNLGNDLGNVNQHVCILRPNDLINHIYLTYQISNNNFQNYIFGMQSGGTREAFNFTQIKQFNVIISPLDLQNQFASIVEKVEAEKTKLEASLKEMEDNFNSIMQRAFKGELF